MRRPDLLRRRRALSLTSLIDIIFLLLLFFMLSSTFTRFGDLPLTAAAAGGARAAEAPPTFVRLAATSITLDTLPVDLADLPARLVARAPVLVLLAPREDVDAQRLVDVLAALRGLPGVTLRVLEG